MSLVCVCVSVLCLCVCVSVLCLCVCVSVLCLCMCELCLSIDIGMYFDMYFDITS